MEQFITDNMVILVPIIYAILSEVIGISKMKSNSLLQLIGNVLKSINKGGSK